MHVSSYEPIIRDAFDKALGELPEDQEKLVKEATDKITDAVVDAVRASVTEYLFQAIKDDLCHEAAKIAESMLMQALAGDDTAIRNLFGFTDYYYMRHAYVGRLPTQWALIDAIVARHPDLFAGEQAAQQARQIAGLNAEVARLNADRQRLRDHYEGR